MLSCIVVIGRRGYLVSFERTETLKSVTDKGNIHVDSSFVASLVSLSTKRGASVILVDLVRGEVLRVNVGIELRLERCTNAAKLVPLYTLEEVMLPDLAGATDPTKPMFSITYQSKA
jgi:hypothetical protein